MRLQVLVLQLELPVLLRLPAPQVQQLALLVLPQLVQVWWPEVPMLLQWPQVLVLQLEPLVSLTPLVLQLELLESSVLQPEVLLRWLQVVQPWQSLVLLVWLAPLRSVRAELQPWVLRYVPWGRCAGSPMQ